MTQPSKPFDFSRLSITERNRLVDEIWYSIHEQNGREPVTASQLDELHQRLRALERGEQPPAKSWDDVRAWLLAP
jgi:putative addiction module component (TIGR02574 family)